MRLTVPAACTTVLLAVLVTATPASATLHTETIYLDTHGVAGTRYATAPSTSALAKARPYAVTVSGTTSLWAPTQWTSPSFQVCGAPKATPAFPSPGVVNGPAGVDAEGRFAIVRTPGACPALPVDTDGNFQLSVKAGTFYNPRPLLPLPPLGSARTYAYVVIGTGAPLTARFFDPASADNYGRFRISVSGLFP